MSIPNLNEQTGATSRPGIPPMPPIAPQAYVQRPSRRKAWLTHGGVALAALVLGTGIGGGGGEADASAKPAPQVTVTETEEVPGPEVTVTETETVTPEPEKPKGPATTVSGEGEYLVGEDMKAGTYKTAGPDGGFGCYWERAKDSSGEFNSIIANQNLDGSGRVTVRKGEVFKSTGCQEWVKVG